MKTQSDVLQILDEEGITASELIDSVDPKFKKRFDRATKALRLLMDDVREHFPDATYYSDSDGLLLMLGDSHDSLGHDQADLIALDNNHLTSILSGGGF